MLCLYLCTVLMLRPLGRVTIVYGFIAASISPITTIINRMADYYCLTDDDDVTTTKSREK